MRKLLLLSAILLLDVAGSANRAAAQGPAGVGAADVTQGNSHSLNPMHWVKKDSKDSADADANRGDLEKKLTPILQAEGALPANMATHDACAMFTDLRPCLAALHASHDLGLNFTCVQASVTGVHTNADVSGCKDADQDKQQSLKDAIRRLKPDANAKQAVKDAEQEAESDLAKSGG